MPVFMQDFTLAYLLTRQRDTTSLSVLPPRGACEHSLVQEHTASLSAPPSAWWYLATVSIYPGI
jgi:hypothetical protein